MLLRTLGGLALEGSAFHRPVPLMLLAFLAVEGPKTRRELADLFFMDARDPRDSLSTTLRRLQQGAPGSIELDGEKVLTGLPCDALELLAAQDAPAAADAIGLYRGPFLQGLDVALGVELEEWLFATRERLAARLRDAYLRLADEAARRGAVTTAAQHIEAALEVTEAPELEAGVERRLQERLGASRQARVATLALQSENQPSTLPFYATSFVGREQELYQIRTLLLEPSCRLLTLHGAGGIGKSRLAARAVEGVGARFQDGAVFVELSALAASQVVSAIASSVGYLLQIQGDILEQITRFLKDRQLLLVLDNYEHLMEVAMLPLSLLAACPDLKVVVTSREPLRLQEEYVLTLAGLAVPDQSMSHENARQADAVRLFMQRARQARVNKTLPDEDLAHVVKICDLVQGSPLGIELTAAWVRALPVAEIAAELAASLDMLTSSARNAIDRHSSVRAVFEHSWALLGEAERTALRRLAVFRGGFDREAAARVAEVPLPMLASLLDKSLLRASTQNRYDFHPLVQQYAQEKLLEHPGEERRTKEAHARFFFGFLGERHQTFLQARSQTFAALEQELENLRAAWEWAAQEGWAAELRLASPLLRHAFDKLAQCREGAALFEGAIAALTTGKEAHQAARGRLLVDQAHFYHYLGAHPDAMQRAQQGLGLLERYGEPTDVRDGLNILAGAIWRQGDYLEAKRIGERSLALSRSLQDERGIANILSYLAAAEQTLNNFEKAERYCRESLDLCRRTGHRAQAVIVLKNYGSLLRVMGKSQEAKPLLEEALGLAQETSYPRVMADILANLALACLDEGEPAIAKDFAEQAVELAATSGIQTFEIPALVALGRSETALGDHRSARAHLILGLTKARSLNNKPLALMPLTALGESWAAQGNAKQAAGLLAFLCRQPLLKAHDRRLAERLLNGLGEDSRTERPSTPTKDVESVIDAILQDTTRERS